MSKMKTKVIIIGGKGGALVVAEQIFDAAERGANVEFLGFAFDDESFGDEINGFPIVCKTYEAYGKYGDCEDVKFLFQLYRPDLMKERIELRESYGIPDDKYYTFVHPLATVARSATIGSGVAVMSGVVINPNTQVGDHCTIHSTSLVGHDSKIGHSNFVAAHSVIGSSNQIGSANFFGLNSSCNNYITIGDHCFIGMASNVTKSLSTGTKVYGNPAKPFERPIKPL
jgi:acetyltransferase EpsM